MQGVGEVRSVMDGVVKQVLETVVAKSIWRDRVDRSDSLYMSSYHSNHFGVNINVPPVFVDVRPPGHSPNRIEPIVLPNYVAHQIECRAST